ncbi:DUF4282 domain-containing protein [Fontimonas thermophila]|nr:DUF4282 domain-containing protein [Fontimonas thermophila]
MSDSDPGFDEGAVSLRARLREFSRGLFDLQFQQLLAPRLLPTIYLLAIAACAGAVILHAIEGFARSPWLGTFRLLVVAPVGFIVLVTVVRVTLEFLLVVFRIAVNVSEMAGHTGDIASGLPRIQFWRGLLGGDKAGHRRRESRR